MNINYIEFNEHKAHQIFETLEREFDSPEEAFFHALAVAVSFMPDENVTQACVAYIYQQERDYHEQTQLH